MLKSLATTYLNVSNASHKTAIIAFAISLLFGFADLGPNEAAWIQDGPVSVSYGNLFQVGELKIEPFGFKDLHPLPAGYAALNDKAYRISTSAVVSGPHTIRFAVPSVTDEGAFKKLRVFQVDKDPFDPDAHVWTDVTLLNSAKSAPSFSAKVVYAQSEGLGIYVIAHLVREIPTSTAIADLVVTTTGVANRLTAPSLISYTINVLNQGPDDANGVGLSDGLSGAVEVVSLEPSQGRCKLSGGHIVCKLGSLRPEKSITVAVKLKPDEGRGSFPQEGKEIIHDTDVRAVETDPNPHNNKASDTFVVLPDPNQPPSVSLDSPQDETLFVGPTDIVLEATAEDPDGSISKVEFFDNERSLGLGTSVDGKKFVLTVRRLSYGNHNFVAVATDNGGRADWSLPKEIFINGLCVVSIKTPPQEALVPLGSDVTLSAIASHPSGVITKLQFSANGLLLGEGSLSGQNIYSFTWKGPGIGAYSILAVAIDGSGIPTFSKPVKFRVGIPP